MPTNGEDKKAILINKAVCEKYQISYDQFLSKSKKREIAQSRQVAHYVIRKNTKLTLKKIGELAGGIAHDNVLYSIRTIEKLMSVDKQLFNDVNELSELF
jgi:chromosomal replication initiator protein